MRHAPAFLVVLSLLLLFASCEQETVDLSPVADAIVWTTIDEFNESGDPSVVWGSGPGDVYVGSFDYSESHSVLRHFDGTQWKDVPLSPNAHWVGDIWGSGSSDVYATVSGFLWHFDGTAWTNTGIGAVRVSGTAPDNVIADDGRNLLRYAGAAWDTLLTVANPGEFVTAFWVGPEPSAIVFLNENFGPDSLMRWNGSSWSAREPVPGGISAFWGPTANDVIAVGSDGNGGMAWHWDGVQWTPTMGSGQWPYLHDVYALGTSDVYAVACAAALHYDGATWQSLDAPVAECFENVWGSSSSDIYLVGRALSHYDGADWTPVFEVKPNRPSAVWADSRGRVVVGAADAVYRLENGTWTEEGRGVIHNVHAVAGKAWNDLYAATSNGVYHHDGIAWTLSPDSPGYILEMFVLPSGEVFASGGFDVYRLDSQGWKRVYAGNVTNGDVALWAFDRERVLFGYADGILRFNGASWTSIYGPAWCSDIWATSEHDVYAISLGWILHSDGGPFERVGPVIPGYISLIAGTSSDHIIAAGRGGDACWQDGRWLAGATPSDRYVLGLAAAGDGSIIRLEASSSGSYRLSYHRE